MATFSDPFTKADLQSFIPTMWADFILELKYANMSIMNFATDLSYLINEGGDTINIPEIYTNEFTVQVQSTEGAQVVDESVAAVTTAMTVNTHIYVAFVIGKKSMRQVWDNYQVSEAYAREARELLVQYIETELFALVSSLTTTPVGDSAAAVDDLALRQAIDTLQSTDGAVFEYDRLAFFFHPTVYFNQILGISKYYEKQKSDFRNTVVVSGNFDAGENLQSFRGRLYDIPVYVSPRIPVSTDVSSNMLLHPEAFAFAMHSTGVNGVSVEVDWLLQNLAWLTVVDAIYGTVAMRPNAGVEIEALNTATVNG